ncbi:adenine methyltransferase [Siculibacillus lacustris]|uniref:Adenine methyltransferase n=1 Tax=Siculibacillus lacustris TaxID=1549641 RepID=A0A4Q9VFA1_9HYPH|nr:MT-A70 family methyltransferase [Siculibacillus lacustris]TBW33373.1 adenine methyltransferase [Siculibacillus lacustris]
MIRPDLASIDRVYRVIYADPPWSFRTWGEAGQDRAPEQHYPTMPLDEIMALPVGDIAANDAALFLWVYQPMLPEALRLIEAWGFEFKTVAFVWVKTSGPHGQGRLFWDEADCRKGLGYHTRAGTEQVWLATRGKGYDRIDKGVGQTVFAVPREHSRKPDVIPHLIDRLVGDLPKLEMFGRTERPGWDVFGNEVGKFGAVA